MMMDQRIGRRFRCVVHAAVSGGCSEGKTEGKGKNWFNKGIVRINEFQKETKRKDSNARSGQLSVLSRGYREQHLMP
jgi:hypothetical protein